MENKSNLSSIYRCKSLVLIMSFPSQCHERHTDLTYRCMWFHIWSLPSARQQRNTIQIRLIFSCWSLFVDEKIQFFCSLNWQDLLVIIDIAIADVKPIKSLVYLLKSSTRCSWLPCAWCETVHAYLEDGGGACRCARDSSSCQIPRSRSFFSTVNPPLAHSHSVTWRWRKRIDRSNDSCSSPSRCFPWLFITRSNIEFSFCFHSAGRKKVICASASCMQTLRNC